MEEKELVINCRKYIESFCKIRDKNSKLILLKFNPTQEKVYAAMQKQARAGKPIRIITLKSRQQGVTTLSGGIILERTATKKNVYSNIIAHESSATDNIFEMIKRMYNNLPDDFKPQVKASNAKELIFNTKNGKGLDSRIVVSVATDDSVGRSFTFQNIHMSEISQWHNIKETYAAVMQCVPNTPDTLVTIESTANGYDEFREMYYRAKRGESDFIAVFSAWFESPEYSMPYSGFTDFTKEEIELKEKYGVTNEQLQWRRWCITNNCNGDINMFHQEYPSNEEEAFISSGNCMFDASKVNERLEKIKEPVLKGYFKYDMDYERDAETNEQHEKIKNITWVNDERGFINIYKESEENVPYVLGGDTAGEGVDYFVGQIIDNITGEQMCTLRNQFDEDLYAKQIYCLGKYYNWALIGVETNFSPYTNMKLQQWDYPNLYIREVEDTMTGRLQEKYGFRTTTLNRNSIIANLVEIVRENVNLINDQATLLEMLTFVNLNGKPQATPGYHDDCIMALAITYAIRQQQSYKKFEKDKEETKGWLTKTIEKINEERNYDDGGVEEWF